MKKWLIRPKETEEIKRLCGELPVSPLLAEVLLNRGLGEAAAAERFIHPRVSYLRYPFEIPNIKKAALRVLLAKERR
ncbi:single-stranded-DNA-specific exonuclease RecJ, partial [Candidatus Saganbacteria bacterium]|nr:single-stranded-DNA-specific exonuclease RecJ [Candidatus Saganbacteria bacterium]